jgi:hypothetical protein
VNNNLVPSCYYYYEVMAWVTDHTAAFTTDCNFGSGGSPAFFRLDETAIGSIIRSLEVVRFLRNATQANVGNTIITLQHRVLALSARLSFRSRALKDCATLNVGSMADILPFGD